MRRRYSAAGFSLLEVLITLVILSIALLGLAKLQMNNIKLSHDSFLRHTAQILAADMIDRMRANNGAFAADKTSPYNQPVSVQTSTCLTTGCTPAQMAQHDFYEWTKALRVALPNGSGMVCIDSASKDGTPSNPNCDNIIVQSGRPTYAIKIWWNERKDSGSTFHQEILEFSP